MFLCVSQMEKVVRPNLNSSFIVARHYLTHYITINKLVDDFRGLQVSLRTIKGPTKVKMVAFTLRAAYPTLSTDTTQTQ